VSWFALRVEPRDRREEVIAALFGLGAHGIQEDDAALLTHFESESEARSAAAAVRALEPGVPYAIDPIADIDWTTAWRAVLRAFPLGNLTIAPPWLAHGLDPSRTVVIEPGMGFGTGDHASTRGAARLLERLVRPGSTVADLGTGSGVLAIAAAKLGARRVYAIEVDPKALDNAQENVERNSATSTITLFTGDARILLPLLGPADLVVANIGATVVVELLDAMATALRPGGTGVIAGILEEEHQGLLSVLSTQGWRLLQEEREEGWWSAAIERA
jgi:ribosomal protein L11 methyltransferase